MGKEPQHPASIQAPGSHSCPPPLLYKFRSSPLPPQNANKPQSPSPGHQPNQPQQRLRLRLTDLLQLEISCYQFAPRKKKCHNQNIRCVGDTLPRMRCLPIDLNPINKPEKQAVYHSAWNRMNKKPKPSGALSPEASPLHCSTAPTKGPGQSSHYPSLFADSSLHPCWHPCGRCLHLLGTQLARGSPSPEQPGRRAASSQRGGRENGPRWVKGSSRLHEVMLSPCALSIIRSLAYVKHSGYAAVAKAL